MKQFIFGFIAVVMFANLSFGQNSNELILKDRKFQDYIREISYFQKLPKDISKLKLYFADKKISEQEYKVLYSALGFKSKTDFEASINRQSSLLRYLEGQYGISNYQLPQISDLISEGFLQIDIPIAPEPIQSTLGDCETKYNNTIAMNFAAAIAGHIGCVTADATVILGLICHGAVATAHALADQNAAIDYRACKK